jgi:hypothetical protein
VSWSIFNTASGRTARSTVGKGKDAEKPWTGVQTEAGTVLENYQETGKWDFALDIAINER